MNLCGSFILHEYIYLNLFIEPSISEVSYLFTSLLFGNVEFPRGYIFSYGCYLIINCLPETILKKEER
jgi:hypothetical protein